MNRSLCGVLLVVACFGRVAAGQPRSSPPAALGRPVLDATTNRGTTRPLSSIFPLLRPAASSPTTPQSATATTVVHPAVVRIFVAEKGSQSIGSGTLVDVRDQFGLVVTNWHVIKDAAGEISVAFPDGFRSAGRVVQHDQDWDLAAISIWRPNVTPVRISPEAPKPGELLTIAGFGSDGLFRAVTGPCTQYLAPSDKHPHEIVELAAQARQGDSGGPIFNSRAELAGVLFGSDRATTSGSYGGRVLKFLEPLLSGGNTFAPPGPNNVAGSAMAGPVNVVNKLALPAITGDGMNLNPTGSPRPVAPLQPVSPEEAAESHGELRIIHTPLVSSTDGSMTAVGPPSQSEAMLQEVLGRTPLEQAKAALSLVGILALAMFALRWSRSEPKGDD